MGCTTIAYGRDFDSFESCKNVPNLANRLMSIDDWKSMNTLCPKTFKRSALIWPAFCAPWSAENRVHRFCGGGENPQFVFMNTMLSILAHEAFIPLFRVCLSLVGRVEW